jgi:riboflavin kinase/FMN adenylyltransferase
VLYPDTVGKDLKLINSQEEKIELLRKAGLDNVIIVNFTKDFSRISCEEFVRDYLKGILNARVIVVGFNHHFGFNQEGDYKHLWNWREKYDFEAEEIPEQEVQHETVSSTKIRKAVREGYIQRANAYLDHYYIIMGRAEPYTVQVDGNIPPLKKVPLTEESKLLPATGVYAVSLVSGTETGKGMAIIHETPRNSAEVLLNIFDDESNFEKDTVTILFHKMIRGTVSLSDQNAPLKLEHARAEINDLVY